MSVEGVEEKVKHAYMYMKKKIVRRKKR